MPVRATTSGASGPAALAFLGYRAAWERGEHAGPDERTGFVELARKDLAVAAESAAEAPSSAGFEPITIEHGFGTTTIEEKPERVATVAWAN